MEFVAMEEELRPPGGSQLLAWTKLGLESAAWSLRPHSTMS